MLHADAVQVNCGLRAARVPASPTSPVRPRARVAHVARAARVAHVARAAGAARAARLVVGSQESSRRWSSVARTRRASRLESKGFCTKATPGTSAGTARSA
jgi:hypothetical protein